MKRLFICAATVFKQSYYGCGANHYFSALKKLNYVQNAYLW